MHYFLVLIALLSACSANVLLSSSIAFADAGDDACKDFVDSDNSNDPCHEALIKKTARKYEIAATVSYAAGAAVCTYECFSPISSGGAICNGAGIASMAVDITGAIATHASAQSVMGSLMAVPQFASMFDEAKEAKPNSDDAVKDKAACKQAVMNGFQAVSRGVMVHTMGDDIAKAQAQKLEMIGKNGIPKVTGDGGGGTQLTQGANGESKDDPLTKAKPVTQDKNASVLGDIISNAAQAGFGDTLKKFEDLTGKSAGELAQRILAGENPTAAAMDMASGKLGAEGTAAGMVIAKTGELAQDALKDELQAADLKMRPSAAAYAYSTSGGSSTQHSDNENPMAGLTEMMAGLFQKPGAEQQGATGPQGVGFGSRTLASIKTSSEGYHLASTSIFDVVNARYSSVSGRILSNSPVGASAGMVPSNPYLRGNVNGGSVK